MTCPTGFVCMRTYKLRKSRVACARGEPAYHAWQLLLLLATNQVHQWACQCCGQLAVSDCHAVPNLSCAISSSIFKLSMQIRCRTAECIAQQNALTPSCKLVANLCCVSTRSDEQPVSRCQVHVRSWPNVRSLSYQEGCHFQMLLQYFQVIVDSCLCCCLYTIISR